MNLNVENSVYSPRMAQGKPAVLMGKIASPETPSQPVLDVPLFTKLDHRRRVQNSYAITSMCSSRTLITLALHLGSVWHLTHWQAQDVTE